LFSYSHNTKSKKACKRALSLIHKFIYMPHYLGVTAQEAWELINTNPKSIIIDVRTPQEWKIIGTPKVPSTQIKFISSHISPDMSANPHFADLLSRELTDKEAPLFFMCRTNGRSKIAVEVAKELGYKNCHLIIDGFEGTAQGKGWVGSNLPVTTRN